MKQVYSACISKLSQLMIVSSSDRTVAAMGTFIYCTYCRHLCQIGRPCLRLRPRTKWSLSGEGHWPHELGVVALVGKDTLLPVWDELSPDSLGTDIVSKTLFWKLKFLNVADVWLNLPAIILFMDFEYAGNMNLSYDIISTGVGYS